MSVDFEPIDVKQDLDLSDVVRTNIEGTSVVDYDVEYGVLPVNPEQLVAPTYNVGVPAEGTLGPYQTDGEGESDIWKVIGATVKAAGKGYVKDAIVKVPGKYPSDIPAVIKITSVEPTVYSVTSASASGTMSGYAANETITVAGASGDTSAVLSIDSVTPVLYNIASASVSGESMEGYVTGETITIPGVTGDTAAVLTITAEEGVITALTVTTAGEFASAISGALTSDDYTYAGEGTGATISVTSGVADAGGAIVGLSVTTAGEFASDISGAVDPAKITYSGSGTGASIAVVAAANADAGAILSVEIVSEGTYARELDGDIDVVAGSGTGGKITVDMEMEEPESGEESGLEE